MLYKKQEELENLKSELVEVSLMSESEVRFKYNVDCKREIFELIEEEISSLNEDVSELSKPSSFELEFAGYRYGYDYY